MIYAKIDMFNNFPYILNKKTSSSIKVWLFFLIFSSIIFIIIAINYQYSKCETYLGYVKKIEEEYYVIVYVSAKDLNDFTNYKLVNKEKFKLESISKDYYIVDNKNYYQLILKMYLKENEKIENNILSLKLEKAKTTLYQQFKKGIKTWIN